MKLALALLLITLSVSCTHDLPKPLLYNAYSPTYDEFFVIKSDRPLSAKDIVWFDDHAQVVNYATPYVATIISPYKSK